MSEVGFCVQGWAKYVDDYFVSDLCHLLESLTFDNQDAINTCFKLFVDCLDDIVHFHAPLKTKTIRKNTVPYMNSELRKIKYKMNIMRNIKNKHYCPENYERCGILRNQCFNIGKCQKSTTSMGEAKVVQNKSTYLVYYQTIY